MLPSSLSHKLQQAQECLERHDVSRARVLCHEVLEHAPRDPDALHLLAISYLFEGRPGDALPVFERVLSVAPKHGAALEYEGLAYLMLGNFAEAERVLQRAVALPGAPASALMRLGVAMLNLGRLKDAIGQLQRALAIDPKNPDCHLNLGHAYAATDKRVAARQEFESVLAFAPGHLEAMFNLGVLAMDESNLDTARQWFERILVAAPHYVDALVNLGLVFQQKQMLDEARNCFERALELDPTHAPARNNLAKTFALQGSHERARLEYLATLERSPQFLPAHEGYAASSLALGRYKEAIEHLNIVLGEEPENASAWGALADALFQSGQLSDSETAANRSRELNPGIASPYTVLANIYYVRATLDRGLAILKEGFERTDSTTLLGSLAFESRRLCDWNEWRIVWPQLSQRLTSDEETAVSPFSLLCQPTTPEQQLAAARGWSMRYRTKHRSGTRRSSARERLRIGYLSSDFHQHATAYLLTEMLELHDRNKYEIFAYSYGPEDHSPARQRLRDACEHFVDIAWEPDDAAGERIRAEELDILVDLKGYTLGARTGILAQRPCAIQVSWLGYPGTMGADFIDYLIADDFVIPPGGDSAYSEKVLRLPHCYQPNDRKRMIEKPLKRAEYGLHEDDVVLCCFNQGYKITPEIFGCWTDLMRAVPRSVLWLLEENPWATDNLKAFAQTCGVLPERIVFAPRLPLAQHLARYQVADVALDTFPYTSHTTASDALWAGCPLVALCGDTFTARVSGSVLTHGGVPELVTYTLADYSALVQRLANDRTLRNDFRSKLATARHTAPLFDSASFARDLETVFTRLGKEESRH